MLCSMELFADIVMIACLRRLQRWCLTSVIDEFRALSLRRNCFDLEQFIEYFDISLVRYPFSLPDYVVNDMSLEVMYFGASVVFRNYYLLGRRIRVAGRRHCKRHLY